LLLPGYQIVRELARTEQFVVHRARRDADAASVLLKTPARYPPRTAQLEGLRQEFALRRPLDSPGVLRVYDLVQSEGTSWLVLEDAGALPLPSVLATGPMEVAGFLHLALEITTILAELHRRRYRSPSRELSHRPVLRDIEKLDTEETARALSLTPAGVKVRLHRARQALRALLDPVMRSGAGRPSE
jgi:serine/threonine protein kinase